MKAFLAALLLFPILCTISPPAQAQQGKEHYPIAQVVHLEGRAWYISPDNKRKIMRADDPIYLNSVVQTGPGTKLMILFIDDTQLILAENSELIIDEYIFDPYDAEENEAAFSITKGAFAWTSGMISKRERPNVKIRTARGIIDVKGTEFWSGAIDDGYGVFVDHGLITFHGEGEHVDIPAGKGVFIGPKDKAPDTAKQWPPDREQRARHQTTFFESRDLEENLKQRRIENVRKRNDYRARMFPYKQIPADSGYLADPEDFFTKEFQELRDRQ